MPGEFMQEQNQPVAGNTIVRLKQQTQEKSSQHPAVKPYKYQGFWRHISFQPGIGAWAQVADKRGRPILLCEYLFDMTRHCALTSACGWESMCP